MRFFLLALIALLSSAHALADDCDNAWRNGDMIHCAAARYQEADKKLNQTWQKVQKRARPEQRPLLKQAQNAWIALRDADCRLIASGAEGIRLQPMIVNDCLEAKTVEREAFLSSLLRCEEGDLSCPLPRPD
ncbi:lysozyme inhibitor LprI family protein [Intestinirhabdus alba]|jgi:uncharacterized protein YecT (DUF1311 family)|uniref:DUF1311 domain-containing protein n=1 Tax=Intestinirhabdus alba TaxID=2899544 RepID=A0A6L6IP96_9ENTR|nr:lysozyme inhibitor LprI family protein [Intestinirhabdus alba]MTH46603.1 DUF1311 domain-containing protein [Intestinirhabdus alba]